MNDNFIYVLKCSDETYYVGRTANLIQRLYNHYKRRGARYTVRRHPVQLVWVIRSDNPGCDESFMKKEVLKIGSLVETDKRSLPVQKLHQYLQSKI